MSKRYLPMSEAELAIKAKLQDVQVKIDRLRQAARIGGYTAEVANSRIAELLRQRDSLENDARMEHHATIFRDLVGDSLGDALTQIERALMNPRGN